jgi:hypothetical protein
VGAVFNARGLLCGCVNRAQKFTPQARVIFFGKQARKNAHDAGLDAHCTLQIGEGDWLRGGARSNLVVRDASRRLTVVFGMLGDVHVPTTHAPKAIHVGIYARKSIGMKNW